MAAGASAGLQAARKRQQAAVLRSRAAELTARADRLELDADRWSRGEQGERVVGEQLERLRALGWEVLHDVRWPERRRANIDHVAVGPGGVLVVDAKNWSGRLAVRSGRLRQNGLSRQREIQRVADAGVAVGMQLQLPWALHVIPVLCTAGPAGTGVTRIGQVTVLGAGDLVEWASSLEARLSPGDVRGVARHLRTVLPPATSRAVRGSRPQSSRDVTSSGVARAESGGHGAGRRRKHARRQQSGSSLVLRLAAAVLLAVTAPTILSWWGERGPEIVDATLPAPASPAESAQPTVFEDCRSLRAEHSAGLKAPGARNQGRPIRTVRTVDRAFAVANTALDRDRDGVVCEVRRKRDR